MRPSLRGFSWCALAALAASVGLLSCGNPAVDVRIETLGPEVDGIEPGEFHRHGQPCVLCHSTYGGAVPQMSIGGTIYATPVNSGEDPVPVEGVTVALVDADGTVATATTNCIGNFYVEKETWNPSFPVQVEVLYTAPGGTQKKRVPMKSRISRDGSCAGCHVGARDQGSPGVVYLVTGNSPFPGPGKDCQGVAK